MIVILLLFTLGSVVASVPAIWLLRVLPGMAQSEGFSGTIWAGRIADGRYLQGNRRLVLGEISWRLEPISWRRMTPCVTFDSSQSDQLLSARLCWGGKQSIELHAGKLVAPAAVLQQWLPLRLTGEIAVDIGYGRISGNQIVELTGSGSWTDAGVIAGASYIGLGSSRVDISVDQDGNILNRYTDTAGPLQYELLSLLSLQGEYVTAGEILLRDGAPREMLQVLPLIAEEQGVGRYQVAWSGQWNQ